MNGGPLVRVPHSSHAVTDLDPARWGLPPGLRARLATDTDDASGVLDAAEAARRDAFGHADRRRQFELGRLAARTLAGERLGVAARSVPLAVGADGAPELDGGHVSIAHTGRAGAAAALAAVHAAPVGVDLERVAPRRPDLWRRLLNASERPALDALGGPTNDAQTLLWTLKESVLKGQRTGFRAGARSVTLSLDADGGPPALGAARAASAGARWRVAFGRSGDLWLAVAWLDEPA